MTTALTERPTNGLDAKVIEQVLLGGDLSRLTPEQRISYYNNVCASLGLNPLTKPFDYLTLNGKTVLYARKDATEQLRMIHSISIDPKAFTREVIEGIYVVTAPASMPSGRTDVSTGAVPIENVKGEARANAMMKAETKAKRRVTLSICGLGMLDETEVDSIPNAKTGDPLPLVIVEAEIGPTETLPEPPDGAVYLRKSEQRETSKGKPYWLLVTHQGEEVIAWDRQLGSSAEQAVQNKDAVVMTMKGTWDNKPVVKSISRADVAVTPVLPELTGNDIAF